MSLKQPTSIQAILGRMLKSPLSSEDEPINFPAPPRQSSSIRTWRHPHRTGHRFSRRHRFIAFITISNGEKTLSGYSQDISDSGMFIAADPNLFQEGEALEVTIIPRRRTHSYKTTAHVVRKACSQAGHRGYGIQFEK